MRPTSTAGIAVASLGVLTALLGAGIVASPFYINGGVFGYLEGLPPSGKVENWIILLVGAFCSVVIGLALIPMGLFGSGLGLGILGAGLARPKPTRPPASPIDAPATEAAEGPQAESEV